MVLSGSTPSGGKVIISSAKKKKKKMWGRGVAKCKTRGTIDKNHCDSGRDSFHFFFFLCSFDRKQTIKIGKGCEEGVYLFSYM